MTFWAYMLQCRGGFLYVGHTDDLTRRVAQHHHGETAGFTHDHLPVALVWSQEFATRHDAKAGERQIKGWSRAKKLALIRGDWVHVSKLARKKDSPSTGSGETGARGLQGSQKPAGLANIERLSFLVPHPDTPPLAVTAIAARITAITDHWLTLRWRVAGAARIVVPPLAGKRRADSLWRRTCFELFVQTAGSTAYAELNFSPDEGWAAYDFAGYRSGAGDRAMPRPPTGTVRRGGATLIFDAAIPLAGLPPRPWQMGMTAVIAEEGGVMSYWAMAHAAGPPDFHHRACLALAVAAPLTP